MDHNRIVRLENKVLKPKMRPDQTDVTVLYIRSLRNLIGNVIGKDVTVQNSGRICTPELKKKWKPLRKIMHL